MTFPERLLTEGEHVVVTTRTHVKALVGAVLVLLVTVFAAVFLGTLAHRKIDAGGARTAVEVGVTVVAILVLVWYVVRPFIGWFTTTYTFTNRRFVARSGFIAREGRTIPLNRISEVDYEVGVLDRLFGCGTLIVSDASEEGRIPLRDIPHVEQVQTRVAEELHRLSAGSGRGDRLDDGT